MRNLRILLLLPPAAGLARLPLAAIDIPHDSAADARYFSRNGKARHVVLSSVVCFNFWVCPPPKPCLDRALFAGEGFTDVERGGLVGIARGAGDCTGQVESELSEGNGEPVDSLYGCRGQ